MPGFISDSPLASEGRPPSAEIGACEQARPVARVVLPRPTLYPTPPPFFGTSRPAATRGISSRRHAYRVDWFRRRQRQNSVSCSARSLPWW